MKKYLLLLTGILIGLIFLLPSLPATAQSTPPTEADITDFLNALPPIAESGGQVLSVTYVGEALVIDLSQEVLPDGAYDDALFAELQSELDAAFQVNQFFMVTFKVEGLPLEDWGMPLPDFSETAEWPLDRELPGDGPLAGYKIALSAGHGLYFNEYYGEWMYQRGEFEGIREDTVNSEIMQYLKAELENQGATVIDTREMDQTPGPVLQVIPPGTRMPVNSGSIWACQNGSGMAATPTTTAISAPGPIWQIIMALIS